MATTVEVAVSLCVHLGSDSHLCPMAAMHPEMLDAVGIMAR